MSKRIFRAIFAVAVVVLLTSSAFIMEVLYSYFESQSEKDLENQAAYIAHAVEKEGKEYLESLPAVNQRITLIDSLGNVLFDNSYDVDKMENHSDREEFINAIQNGFGKSERTSETLGASTFYYAKLLSDGNVIRVAASHSSVMTLFVGVIQPFFFILIGALVIALIIASSISKKIVKPINELDLEHPDQNEVYDEISPLLGKIMKQNRIIESQLADATRMRDEFSAITENMSEGFIVIDDATTVLSYNSSALHLLDFSGNAPIGSVYTLDRSEKFRKTVEKSLQGSRADCIFERNDTFFQMISTPVFDRGKVKGAVILLLDVTEKTERENLRREFSANVSHELKTPLTSISGFAELMAAGNVSRENTVDFSNSILEESRRLITLVNDIIKLSALDEDAVPYEKEKTDLYKIALSVVADLAETASSKHVSINVSGKSGAYVSGVPSLLSELVYNLCDNAIKYNIPDGRIDLSVSHENDGVVLSVKDTGIGIPADQKERVFERFYRVDKSHSKEIGGTGLGLSIVKHSAMYHGASVSLESKLGEGTQITVVFPEWTEKDT